MRVRLILILALSLVAAPAAFAQQKEGFYIGAQGSLAKGKADFYGLHVFCFILCQDTDPVGISGSMAGGTVGYAYPWRNGELIALELSYSQGDVSGTGAAGAYDCGAEDVCEAKVSDLKVLRVVATMPSESERLHFIGTTGIASGTVHGSVRGACPGPWYCGETNALGITLGAGVQGPVSKSFFWRGELQWVWLPALTKISGSDYGNDGFGVWTSLTQLQAGIYYQF